MNPEEQARLEAEAEAEAEFQFQQQQQQEQQVQAPQPYAIPQEDPNESTQGRMTGTLKGIAEGALSPFAMVGDLATRGVVGAARGVVGGLDAIGLDTGIEVGQPTYPSQMLRSGLDSMTQDYPSSEASRNTGNIAGMLPGALAIPSSVPRMAAAAESLPLIPKALAIGGTMAGEGAVMGAAANAAGGDMGKGAKTGALMGLGTGMATTGLASVADDVLNSGLRKYLFGSSESSRAVQEARADDYIGPPLGVGQKNINSEIELAKDLREHATTFDRTNPVADIKVIPGREREAFEQFQGRLQNIEVDGVRTRNNLLPIIAEAENKAAQTARASGIPYKAGVSIEDIPVVKQTPKGEYGIQQMYDNAGTDGKVGVERAKQFIDEKFGIVPSKLVGESGEPLMSPGRPLSLPELNQVRKEIDGQIAEIGGYDFMQPANASKNPSAENAYANTLSFYRQQIDQVVKKKIGELLGDGIAKSFTEAGQNISMVKDVAPQAETFLMRSGQARTTKAPVQVAAGGSVAGKLGKVDQTIDYLVPGTGQAKLQDKGFAMPGEAITRLQRIVNIRNNNFVDPLARDWNVIKGKSSQLATIGLLATQMGLIQSPEQLASMPDIAGKQVAAAVAQAAPDMFVPTQDGVAVMDDKYLNPVEKDALVMQALDGDAETRARVVGSSFQNKYQPLNKAPAVPPPAIPQQPSLSDLNGMFATPTPTQPTDSISMLESLTNSRQRTAGDYVQ